MRLGLPTNHDIPDSVVAGPLLRRNRSGEVELTDVQYEALAAGVARGASVLVVAPTSSGKTDVGFFAAASWLARNINDGGRVVYLTSHKALARQKYREFRERIGPLFSLDPTEMVLATGDDVTDANGDLTQDAFSATLLIATYEKYLSMVSGAGWRTAGNKVCCIADEIQLIGDEHRGQSVEILMTMLRSSVGQIVSLSAVMQVSFAELLASWLNSELVLTTRREVPLIYELRSPKWTLTTSTETEAAPEQSAPRSMGTIETLRELLTSPGEHEPIAVFCMTKKQVFDLAEEWSAEAARMGARVDDDMPLFSEPTASADELGRYLPHRFAYHTADLNEEERIAVEARLDGNALRVVFATTTLAAGLNYSFRTVILHKWGRYNRSHRVDDPISRGEFHNMAGRAGRLSHVDRPGRVIFFANTPIEERAAGRYLSWWELDEFAPRIDPAAFPLLCLQLVSAGVAEGDEELFAFLQSTLSAERELAINRLQPQLWREAMNAALTSLREWRFLV